MTPLEHIQQTYFLASQLSQKDIHRWLVVEGFYPEPYVLPPCFEVTKHPSIGRVYFPLVKKFNPSIESVIEISFPKSALSDRTFGIISPCHNHEIAKQIARNWKTIIKCLFNSKNKVASYSFPIPLDSKTPGKIGQLRSGRMIYEFIEMAENDLASISHRFKFLITTDVKNFYPSIYTHSISWALHGKNRIRRKKARWDYTFVGNRLDKLFHNCNDGCTNGIPIGPAVSDLISEVVLSAVDAQLSVSLTNKVVVVRFKDDYRILCNSEDEGRKIVKILQACLRDFKLDINESKTEIHHLPEGLFRKWVSKYHSANPRPKIPYTFKRFKEVYLTVVSIDKEMPGTGVIDRFLADISGSNGKTRIQLDKRSLPKIVSMLLMLGRIRTKAYPMILAIIEALLKTPLGRLERIEIAGFLRNYLQSLLVDQMDNAYLIAWLIYFLRSNSLVFALGKGSSISNPIPRATFTSRSSLFKSQSDFKLFTPVARISKKKTMLSHLAIFDRNSIHISATP